jgi:endonuclease YncB( thermonuclease family)
MISTQRTLLSALILILVLLLPSLLLAGQYQVYRVVDGYTFIVKHGDIKITIRLVGIDAPELSNKKRRTNNPFPGNLRSTWPPWC